MKTTTEQMDASQVIARMWPAWQEGKLGKALS